MELLIGLFIISLAILAVIKMIDAANGHINKIKQETIAINLAREGMEGMYNRRNTNRLKYPSEKDSYRFCADNECNDAFSAPLLTWILEYEGNKTPSFRWREVLPSLETSLKTYWDTFLLKQESFINNNFTTVAWWKYYRAIIVLWLYQKDVNMTWWYLINCDWWASSEYGKSEFEPNGTDRETPCGDNTPKELRFCSRVEYEGLGAGNGKVELCWSMTNYKE